MIDRRSEFGQYVRSLEGLEALTVEVVVENLRIFQAAGTQLNVRGALDLLNSLGDDRRLDRPTLRRLWDMLDENLLTSAEWNLVGMIQQFERLAHDIRQYWS